MRKDVRMGFAVGGVLLAVIIVAVLVVHHGKTHNKTVAFEPGNGAGGGASAIDATGSVPPTDGAGGGGSGSDGGAGSAQPPTRSGPADPGTHKGDGDDAGPPAADDRWSVLFASTAANPVRSQLNTATGSGNNSPAPAVRGSKATPLPDSAAPSGGAGDSVAAFPAGGSSAGATGPAHATDGAGNSRRATVNGSGATAAPRTHKVQSGETFSSIAKAVYGDGRYYLAIERANPNVNPERLKPGVTIQLPAPSDLQNSSKGSSASSTPDGKASARKPSSAGSTGTAGAALASDGKSYTVRPGDNLYRIARTVYGSGEREDDLFEANRSVIGEDRAKLKPGMVLRLPDLASAGAAASH